MRRRGGGQVAPAGKMRISLRAEENRWPKPAQYSTKRLQVSSSTPLVGHENKQTWVRRLRRITQDRLQARPVHGRGASNDGGKFAGADAQVGSGSLCSSNSSLLCCADSASSGSHAPCRGTPFNFTACT